jgi:hypothetical protein
MPKQRPKPAKGIKSFLLEHDIWETRGIEIRLHSSEIPLISKKLPTKLLWMLVKELRKQQSIAMVLLNETTQTWEGERPKWKKGSWHRAGARASVDITANPGTDFGAQKWAYLDRGTDIRWALMSRGTKTKKGEWKKTSGWRSKTAPLRWSAQKGRGAVVLKGQKAMMKANVPPQRGIDKRRWTEMFVSPTSGVGMYQSMFAGVKGVMDAYIVYLRELIGSSKAKKVPATKTAAPAKK